jgi:hypothetical protein
MQASVAATSLPGLNQIISWKENHPIDQKGFTRYQSLPGLSTPVAGGAKSFKNDQDRLMSPFGQ